MILDYIFFPATVIVKPEMGRDGFHISDSLSEVVSGPEASLANCDLTHQEIAI